MEANTPLLRHLWRILMRHERAELAEALLVQRVPAWGRLPRPELRARGHVFPHDIRGRHVMALMSATGRGRQFLGQKVLKALRLDADVAGKAGILLDVRITGYRGTRRVVALLDPAGRSTFAYHDPDGHLRLGRRCGIEWTTYGGYKSQTVVELVRKHIDHQGTPPRRIITVPESYSGWDPEADLAGAARYALGRFYGSDHVLASAVPPGDLLSEESWLQHGYAPLDAEALAAAMAAMWNAREGRVRTDFDPSDIPRSPTAYLLASDFYGASLDESSIAA